jgi:hypothetical protein
MFHAKVTSPAALISYLLSDAEGANPIERLHRYSSQGYKRFDKPSATMLPPGMQRQRTKS